jgi:glycosyltransferase involved in cell wall biosynthesis
MRAFDQLGVTPLVISPEKRISLTQDRNPLKQPPSQDQYEDIPIIRPRYMPLSSKMLPLVGSTFRWTLMNFSHAVLKAKSSIGFNPTLTYGHFLMPGGVGALRLAKEFDSKAVVALGEGSFSRYETHFGVDNLRSLFAKFWRIVSVSQATRDLCVDRYGVDAGRIEVFPNAVNENRFYPRPKTEMRRKLGLPENGLIIAFVGFFDENKGPHRILKAIENRPDIRGVFLGSGPVKLDGPQVLTARRVAQDEVPMWLSAADMYVQPVIMEASSNSMREAAACGLPVITSDIATNREFLDESHASLVDPLDIGQLRTEIERLADSPDLRNSMSKAALAKAQNSNITTRASRILEWLELI